MSSKKQTNRLDKAGSKQRTPKPAIENLDIVARQQPHLTPLIQRAKLDPGALTPRDVLQLQRLIGNQVTGQLVAKKEQPQPLQKAASTNTSLDISRQSDKIQRWPEPEVGYDIDKGLVNNYKCHDAVVYWVLCSMMKPKEALKALNLIHSKRGQSTHWVIEALGYTTSNKLTDDTWRDQISVGDILWVGAPSFPAHSMVVTDANGTIKGFNNYGTFGTKGGGDQYSTESLAALKTVEDKEVWNEKESAMMKTGNPFYIVKYDTAQTSLARFLERIPEEQGKDFTLDHSKKKKGGCFITTAVVEYMGKDDDCEELQILRRFRDTYLTNQPRGEELVQIYYEYSPLIVARLEEEEEAEAIYEGLYKIIRKCVEAIKVGENDYAYKTYCEMVLRLREQYIPEVEVTMSEVLLSVPG